MKILDAKEVSVEVECQLFIEHEGRNYKWVGFYTENMSGYDWYEAYGHGNWAKISDPDWAEDDMHDLFDKEWALKGAKKEYP